VHLIQGRFVLALGFSTAAHAGLALMVSDPLAPSAAPAQRALSVAMAPAAPRAVLNSIAPAATAALSPPLVRPLSAPRAETIDEPDSVVVTRSAETVASLDAPLVETHGPEHRLRARDGQAAVVALAAAAESISIRHALARDSVQKPSPPPAASAARRRVSAALASPQTAAAAAPQSQSGKSTTGADASRSQTVTGQPGADREAAPASGNEPPEYPWIARARGHQGRVVLSVWVSAEGEAQRLAVLKSSGYSALDRAAVDAVQHWRFQPARRAGVDTQSLVYVPVMFRLDGN
jgi:TonB family protein